MRLDVRIEFLKSLGLSAFCQKQEEEIRLFRKEETVKKVYDYLGLEQRFRKPDSHESHTPFYVFSDPTITAKVKYIDACGGQGCSISRTEYYGGQGRKLGDLSIKPYICALELMAPFFHSNERKGDEDEGNCADPRIVATDVFVNCLAVMLCQAPGTEIAAKHTQEINAVLNPTFSDNEAFVFLEKNGFIGDFAWKRLAQKKYGENFSGFFLGHEVWNDDRFPGWRICNDLESLSYVPPRMRAVYDKCLAVGEKYSHN